MDAKEILAKKCRQLDISQPFWGNQKVTAAQAIGAMQEYHQAKSKEEAGERLNKAWEYLEERASREEGGVVSYGKGGYIIDSLIIASGKEES